MAYPPHATMTHLITQYGSFGLFALLAFGIVGLPIPDETLLVFAGFMMAKGHLTISATLIAAITGSMCGISVSYLLGRSLGYSIAKRYGKYVGITASKIQTAHDWFQRIGKWLLLIGYFIPGIRHLAGFVAGATKLEYPIFALFAYTGATLWASSFIAIGYFFFQQWQRF